MAEHLVSGNYLSATVFADVEPSMRIFREEIFGPVVCVTPFGDEAEAVALANATAYEHYRSLGFGLSETIEDAQTLYAAWMFRKQTVHDVAFTGGEGPRLHHLGFFAHESHQVLRICDILGSLHEECLIERGPGRHGVSNAFYVYLRDPDGHRVEIYTSDYFTGDPGHPGAALVGARPAAPGLLGPPGDPVLVHRSQRRARPGRPPAPAAAGKADRRGHRGRGRLYQVTPVNALPADPLA